MNLLELSDTHTMNISVIHDQTLELAEGIYRCQKSGQIAWVNITRSELFIGNGISTIKRYSLPEPASKIMRVIGNDVILASTSGICAFNTRNDHWQVLYPAPSWSFGRDYRANDGIYLGEEQYLYGRMLKQPEALTGDIVLATEKGSSVIYEGIAIPNTFAWFPNSHSMLISDSLCQKTYSLTLDLVEKKVMSVSLWRDFSDLSMTPDGACVNQQGEVYIAMWGGAALYKLSATGDLLTKIDLPVLQPTSCTLSEDESRIYVTSATEGMSADMLKRYPLSGDVFEIAMNTVPI